MKQEIFIFQIHDFAQLTLIEDERVIIQTRGYDDIKLLKQLTEVDLKRFAIDPISQNFDAYQIKHFSDLAFCQFLYGYREV